MKIVSILLLSGVAALAGCSTTANNGAANTNANIRGTNTNTGYVTNSETNAKPTIPANATNISPGNIGGSGSNSNSGSNSHMNSNTNSGANKMASNTK